MSNFSTMVCRILATLIIVNPTISQAKSDDGTLVRLASWDISARRQDRFADLKDFPRELLLSPDRITSIIPQNVLFHTVRTWDWVEDILANGFYRTIIQNRTTTPRDQGFGLYTTTTLEYAIPMRSFQGEPGWLDSEPTLILKLADAKITNVVDFEHLLSHPQFLRYARMPRAEAMAEISATYHIDIFLTVAGGGRQNPRRELIVQNEAALLKPVSIPQLLSAYRSIAKDKNFSYLDRARIIAKLRLAPEGADAAEIERVALARELRSHGVAGDISDFKAYLWVRPSGLEDLEFLISLIDNESNAIELGYLLRENLNNGALASQHVEIIVKAVRDSGKKVNWLLSAASFYDFPRKKVSTNFLERLIEAAERDTTFSENFHLGPYQLDNDEFTQLKRFYSSKSVRIRRLMLNLEPLNQANENELFYIYQKLLMDADEAVRSAAFNKLERKRWLNGSSDLLFTELLAVIPKLNMKDRLRMVKHLKTFVQWRELSRFKRLFIYAGVESGTKGTHQCAALLTPPNP